MYLLAPCLMKKTGPDLVPLLSFFDTGFESQQRFKIVSKEQLIIHPFILPSRMSDAEPSKPSSPPETGYTPGDDGFTRWRNTFNLLLGRMTEEGVEQYKKGRDDRYEEQDCKRCEKNRDWLLQYST